MITKDKLAALATAHDDGGMEQFRTLVAALGIDMVAVDHMVEQRALRAALLLIERRSLPVMAGLVALGPEAKRLFPALAATWLDGFALGLEAARVAHEPADAAKKEPIQ